MVFNNNTVRHPSKFNTNKDIHFLTDSSFNYPELNAALISQKKDPNPQSYHYCFFLIKLKANNKHVPKPSLGIS